MDMEKTEPTGRIYYDQIDALKGIAIFLVVLGHSIILYPIDLHQDSICDFVFRWLSSVHMPLFFMISGFCFSYKGEYKPFIWKKIRRLFIPYLVFNALDLVPRSLFPSLINRPRGIMESIHKIVFDGGEYWFLYTLLIIFAVYPFIYKFIKRNWYLFAGFLAALLILYAVVPTIPVFRFNDVIYYSFFFTTGVAAKEYLGSAILDIKLGKFKTAAVIAILLAFWIFLIELNTPYPYLYPYLTIVTAFAGIFTLCLCTRYHALIQIFKRFGKYSLQIYLFNGYLLVISRTIIVSLLGMTNPFIIIVFNMLVDFLLSYLVIKYICERVAAARFCMGML